MSGLGGSVYKIGNDSKREPVGTIISTKELLSKDFPGIIWERHGTQEFGYYRPTGGGQVAFGIFDSRAMLNSLDIELKGKLGKETFDLLNEVCGKNGWNFQSDDEHEELLYKQEAESKVGEPKKMLGAACNDADKPHFTGSTIMAALQEAKAKALGINIPRQAVQGGTAV